MSVSEYSCKISSELHTGNSEITFDQNTGNSRIVTEVRTGSKRSRLPEGNV